MTTRKPTPGKPSLIPIPIAQTGNTRKHLSNLTIATSNETGAMHQKVRHPKKPKSPVQSGSKVLAEVKKLNRWSKDNQPPKTAASTDQSCPQEPDESSQEPSFSSTKPIYPPDSPNPPRAHSPPTIHLPHFTTPSPSPSPPQSPFSTPPENPHYTTLSTALSQIFTTPPGTEADTVQPASHYLSLNLNPSPAEPPKASPRQTHVHPSPTSASFSSSDFPPSPEEPSNSEELSPARGKQASHSAVNVKSRDRPRSPRSSEEISRAWKRRSGHSESDIANLDLTSLREDFGYEILEPVGREVRLSAGNGEAEREGASSWRGEGKGGKKGREGGRSWRGKGKGEKKGGKKGRGAEVPREDVSDGWVGDSDFEVWAGEWVGVSDGEDDLAEGWVEVSGDEEVGEGWVDVKGAGGNGRAAVWKGRRGWR